MVSRAERGAYGTGKIFRGDWKDYNPLGLKRQEFPQEQVCPFCGTKADYLFPINDVVLCLPHAEMVMERYGEVPMVSKPFTSIKGDGYCHWCGVEVPVGVKMSTYICHKCTVHLGKMEKGHRVKEAALARKVA